MQKTIYTSTITVPVYASWKCEKCGEINFAFGTIECRREVSTTSMRPSKNREAEEKVANLAKAEWAGEAYKIISDPNHSGSEMYQNLFFQNTTCTKCGKKPRWNKNAKFMFLLYLAVLTAIISGLIALTELTSVAAWLVFLASVGFIVWRIISENKYIKMMLKLPKQNTPVIGSLNAELIEYAKTLGKTIPNPDECISLVKVYDQVVNATTPKVQLTNYDTSFENNTSVVQTNYCRKCGAELQADSGFCHKCGTEIIK